MAREEAQKSPACGAAQNSCKQHRRFMSCLLYVFYIVAGTLIVSSCAESRRVYVEKHYNNAMFVRAMQNDSVSPDYVLVTVFDVRHRKARVVCVETVELERALHVEFGIPYDEPGVRRVQELALKQSDMVFRLSKADALRSVRPLYSEADVDSVRSLIVGRPDSDLLDIDFVRSLYINYPPKKQWRYKTAVAHALLERGISCRRGDAAPVLFPYK